jgi:hypothetical protein
MKPNLFLAYVTLILGCWVASLLSDPDVQRMRALALSVLAVGLWFLMLPAAFIACADAWRRMLEADARMLEADSLRPNDPQAPAGELTRYMVDVDAASGVILPAIDERDLRALAAGLLIGRPFSEREWSKKLHGNFRYIQDQFEARELVTVSGKRRELNGRGRRAMLEVYYGHSARLPPLPLPSS